VLGHVRAICVEAPRRSGRRCHRDRDRMSGEDDADVREREAVACEPGERGGEPLAERSHEPRVIEVLADPVDLDLPDERRLLEGAGQVLPVLPTAGVGRVRAGDEGEDSAVTVGVEALELGSEVGVPVPVAPVDREVDPAGAELRPEGARERAVLAVDRADPVEREVVVRDLLEALPRDPAAAGDVLEERHHVVRRLGSAEGDEQEGIVGARHRSTSTAPSTSTRRPVWKGISSRTCRRACVCRRSRMRSTRSCRSSASSARIHS